MVSPTETDGQDATDAGIGMGPRAAPSGEAIAYSSRGSFGDPSGASVENELVSRRGPEGWATQDVTPLFDPKETETASAYTAVAFTPDLGEGLASTTASLPGTEAPTPGVAEADLYLADFATGAYRYVAETSFPMGASTDLSRVVFGEQGEVSEWLDGITVPVGVSNEDELMNASVGNEANVNAPQASRRTKDVWHAVSGEGARVYFTSPGFVVEPVPGIRQLYVRVNVGQMQSPLASPEANGTGTLTAGSEAVSALVTAVGTIASTAELEAGSTELPVRTAFGQFDQFVVGQPISAGSAIAPGTTIAKFSAGIVTLSKPTTAKLPKGSLISSGGPAPFAVGQEISGNGIAPGTTIAAVAAGALTLSKPAVSSGGAVELRAGGECTVPADGCTVDVSASQRQLENPAGPQPARYWGASEDGSKVFFTSSAELTEDADTSAGAANLYEYDVNTKELTDLTVPTKAEQAEDPEGAAVQGVAQISEDGAYVYFVAKGALAAGASEQQCRAETPREQAGAEPKQDNLGCNLYVVHEGGAAVFVATLAKNDQDDWSTEQEGKPERAGPGYTTAVVSPGGGHLAFMSERSLTGYDNHQAQPKGVRRRNRGNRAERDRELP